MAQLAPCGGERPGMFLFVHMVVGHDLFGICLGMTTTLGYSFLESLYPLVATDRCTSRMKTGCMPT